MTSRADSAKSLAAFGSTNAAMMMMRPSFNSIPTPYWSALLSILESGTVAPVREETVYQLVPGVQPFLPHAPLHPEEQGCRCPAVVLQEDEGRNPIRR